MRAPGQWCFLETVIDTEAVTDPLDAVIVPVPGVVAVNLVGVPGFGENVPRVGLTDHAGVTDTTLPYRSRPVAPNDIEEPARTCAPAGETLMLARTPGVTRSVWVAFV